MGSFSSVVASRDNEKTIEQALESLRNNGSEEIMLVDGGSSDRTLEKALKYKEVKIVRGIKGIARAKDLGWRSSNKTFVLFLDADAYITRSTVSRLFTLLKDPNVAGVACRVGCANRNKLLPRLKDFYFQQIYAERFKSSDVAECDADPTICGLFKKSMLEYIDGYDVKYPYAEDLKLLSKFRDKGLKVLMVRYPVVYHYHREDSRGVYLQHYLHGYGKGLLNSELDGRGEKAISLNSIISYLKRITRVAVKGNFSTFLLYPAYLVFIEFAFRLGYLRSPRDTHTLSARALSIVES
ncbi:glycosyltransferase [Candidatus Bathyarchaeota archaeon]|nr:glycosyltransferase [Candidatus Bathyarchaeota archaeon]